MDKDENYDILNITSGLWETDTDSLILKQFRDDFAVYEAERQIITRLLQQMLNNEE